MVGSYVITRRIKIQLCDVNFFIRNALYCKFVSLKMCSTKVDKILFEVDTYTLLIHFQRLHIISKVTYYNIYL